MITLGWLPGVLVLRLSLNTLSRLMRESLKISYFVPKAFGIRQDESKESRPRRSRL